MVNQGLGGHMSDHKELFFTRYERFWHWSQAVLIVALMVTGFHVTGLFEWLDYEHAARWHRNLAFSLIWLWIFTIFWHLITGEWRQYIPTTEKMMEVIHYYSKGMFDHRLPHPFKKTRHLKHNPLQRVAYLVLNTVLSPVLWVSGLLFVYYNDWKMLGIPSELLSVVAGVHVSMAYAMTCFFILHFYMAFISKPPTAMVKAMITGYVEVEDRALDLDREYRLLIVDDDPFFTMLVKEWFKSGETHLGEAMLPRHLTIVDVESLERALEILKHVAFDLIVLDLALPDSEGIETFRKVRDKAENIPVLVMTDKEDEELQSQGIHEGAQDFLIKNNLSRRILARSFRFALERHWFLQRR